MEKYIKNIVSLDNIRQWEEHDSLVTESVSQHSFKVAAIAAYLLDEIEQNLLVKDVEWWSFKARTLQHAILHDFDESILGRDISHVLKYNKLNGDKIRKELDKYVIAKVSEMGLTHLVANFKSTLMELMIFNFVKMCDWVALRTFINRNEQMGNKSFKEEHKYCYDNTNRVVQEVEVMIQKHFPNEQINLNSYIWQH